MSFTKTPFYTETLETYRKKMQELTPAEEDKFNNYLNFISLSETSSDEQHEEKTHQQLAPCTAAEIYKFCKKSEKFKSFCEDNLFVADSPWAIFLQEQGYLGEEIFSLDQRIHLSLLDQYQGAYHYSNYQQLLEQSNRASALLALDLACEFNLFQALVARCEHNQEKIKSDLNDHEKAACLQKIYLDIKILSNLYGTVGFFHAALVLLDIAQFYNKEGKGNVADAIFTASLECFLCGKKLLEPDLQLPDNEKILKAIYRADVTEVQNSKVYKDKEASFFAAIPKSILNEPTVHTNVTNSLNELLKSKNSSHLRFHKI